MKLATAYLDLTAQLEAERKAREQLIEDFDLLASDAEALAKERKAREEAEHENRYLRIYGNKDCTAMADEAIRALNQSAAAQDGMVMVPVEPTENWVLQYMQLMRLASESNARAHIRAMLKAYAMLDAALHGKEEGHD